MNAYSPILEPARKIDLEVQALPPHRIRFSQGRGGAFYRTVRLRVEDYFAQTGNSRYADRTIWIKSAAYFSIVVAAYWLILFGGFGPWAMLALANVYGVAALLLAINLGHDGAHAAISRLKWVNEVALYGTFMLIGADPYLWQLRHVRSHHIFPNVNGSDIDIDSNIFLRLSPNQRKRWYQRYQHLYAPFVFWLVDIHTAFIQDFHYLFKRKLANMVDIKHPPSAYFSFVACKVVFIAIVFAIPALLLPIPWWQVLIGALLMSFVSSCVFVYLLIGTHFAEETAFPVADAAGQLANDWATHAMLTSLDWSPYSRAAHAIAGGSNAHAAHHLFPNISHTHYPEITRIVAETVFGVVGVNYGPPPPPPPVVVVEPEDRWRNRYARTYTVEDDSFYRDCHQSVNPAGVLGGAVIGGILGNAIGRGGNRAGATVAGVVVGGAVGAALTSRLNCEDRGYAYKTYVNGFNAGRPNTRYEWRNPRNGNYGEFQVRDYYRDPDGFRCANYTQRIYVDGRPQAASGRAGQQPDGSWAIVS